MVKTPNWNIPGDLERLRLKSKMSPLTRPSCICRRWLCRTIPASAPIPPTPKPQFPPPIPSAGQFYFVPHTCRPFFGNLQTATSASTAQFV